MTREIRTVGELKKALEVVPDDLGLVVLGSEDGEPTWFDAVDLTLLLGEPKALRIDGIGGRL